ncbi:MAG TPA: hypothetical protein VD994_12140 [Prosthecobacter sp.]|nr:hypothetical protein [Prosthecobacter sp.]
MNKKVRSRPVRSGHDLARQSRRPQLRQLQSRSRELDEEIHRLECTIAAAPHAIRRRRLAYIDTLPPPEPLSSPARRKTSRLPLHQQRARQRQRVVLMVELTFVIAALAAAVGWMKQWFHLW